MTARTGLADLITALRSLTSAGTADFTDDQMQLILDRHRAELNNSACSPIARMVGGVAQYLDYYIGYPNLEAGTALAVEDGVGNAYGTATYSVDAARGIITFSADNKGLPVYVTGRTFDLNATAAEVWRQKAAAVANAYDFSTDNHRMNRSQMYKAYMDMAAMYEGMSVPTNNKIDRDDTVRNWMQDADER